MPFIVVKQNVKGHGQCMQLYFDMILIKLTSSCPPLLKIVIVFLKIITL